jgi:hypothetical protein
MTTPQIQSTITASTYTMASASASTANSSSIKLTPKEIQAYICPLSLDKFEDPVIDACGHTFDRFWLTETCRLRSKDGINFPCPLDPSKTINITQVKKNYALADAMEETEKNEEEKIPLFLRMAKIEERFDTEVIRHNEAMAAEQKRHNAEMADITDKAQTLKMQGKIRKRQNENLLNMSLGDRIHCVFFCSYLQDIQNRGIDDLELSILTDRVTLKKQS